MPFLEKESTVFRQWSQMINDYVTQFDNIITKVQGLDLDGPSAGDDNRSNHARNCFNALKGLIRSISANRKELPRTFSRTVERFGVRDRVGGFFKRTALDGMQPV